MVNHDRFSCALPECWQHQSDCSICNNHMTIRRTYYIHNYSTYVHGLRRGLRLPWGSYSLGYRESYEGVGAQAGAGCQIFLGWKQRKIASGTVCCPRRLTYCVGPPQTLRVSSLSSVSLLIDLMQDQVRAMTMQRRCSSCWRSGR